MKRRVYALAFAGALVALAVSSGVSGLGIHAEIRIGGPSGSSSSVVLPPPYVNTTSGEQCRLPATCQHRHDVDLQTGSFDVRTYASGGTCLAEGCYPISFSFVTFSAQHTNVVARPSIVYDAYLSNAEGWAFDHPSYEDALHRSKAHLSFQASSPSCFRWTQSNPVVSPGIRPPSTLHLQVTLECRDALGNVVDIPAGAVTTVKLAITAEGSYLGQLSVTDSGYASAAIKASKTVFRASV